MPDVWEEKILKFSFLELKLTMSYWRYQNFPSEADSSLKMSENIPQDPLSSRANTSVFKDGNFNLEDSRLREKNTVLHSHIL